MPRPQSTAGGRPVIVTIRLSNYEAKRLDALRGSRKRSEFMRDLLSRTPLSDTNRPEVVSPDPGSGITPSGITSATIEP